MAMNVGDVIAEILKRERVKILFVDPLTPMTEFAAAIDIRPLVVRQERIARAMADLRPPEFGRRRGRVLLSGRSGHRELFRRGGAGLLRRGAPGGHRSRAVAGVWRTFPPTFTRR